MAVTESDNFQSPTLKITERNEFTKTYFLTSRIVIVVAIFIGLVRHLVELEKNIK